MKQKQSEILETCVKLILEGASLEECFAKFPEMTLATRRILETTKEVMNLSSDQVPTEAMNRDRSKLLSELRELRIKKNIATSDSGFDRIINPFRRFFGGLTALSPLAYRLLLTLAVTGLLILFSGGLVITSAKSLPGDTLYPVKRAVEDLRVQLIPNSTVRTEYENNYDQERVDEIKQLIVMKRSRQISFEGSIESISNDLWIIDGVLVRISTDTSIISGSAGGYPFEEGTEVEVEGVTDSQGWVIANVIHLREYQIIGNVEKIGSRSLQISGSQYILTAGTQVDAGLKVGDEVTVFVRSEDDGLYAVAIRRAGQATETPEIIPTDRSDSTESGSSSSEEEHQFIGTLESISGEYWIVSGQFYNLNPDTHYSGDFKIGDGVKIKYKIEENGTYTLLEIERVDSPSLTQEVQPQETPTPGEQGGLHETLVATPTPDGEHQGTQTPGPSETPQPTRDD